MSKKFYNNDPWDQSFKEKYGRNLRIFIIRYSVYPWQVEHLKGASLGQAPGLTHKHYTRLKRLARDKTSGLLQKPIKYGCKKFYNIGPWWIVLTAEMPTLPLNLDCQPIHLTSKTLCWQKCRQYRNTIMPPPPALASLGGTAELEIILFVSFHPRQSRLVGVAQLCCNIVDIFANKKCLSK